MVSDRGNKEGTRRSYYLRFSEKSDSTDSESWIK